MKKLLIPLLIEIVLVSTAMGQSKKRLGFVSKHQFSNKWFTEDRIKVRVGYGDSMEACDTIFIGNKTYYVLIAGNYNGWTKYDKIPPNAYMGDGYQESQEVNPKKGRSAPRYKKGERRWMVFIDDGITYLKRITCYNYTNGAYITYLP